VLYCFLAGQGDSNVNTLNESTMIDEELVNVIVSMANVSEKPMDSSPQGILYVISPSQIYQLIYPECHN
jgi:hypothetical protein